jgi:hypothetical protein
MPAILFLFYFIFILGFADTALSSVGLYYDVLLKYC